jgi:hypothetical protein
MAPPIPVFITVRDFGSPAAAMVRWLLELPGQPARPIVVDNASTWEPWLDWLERAPCEVVRLPENLGPRAALTVCSARLAGSPYYVITDGDLDLAGVPADVFELLSEALDRLPRIGKAGLSLRIDDLPDGYPWKDRVLDVEGPYWQRMTSHFRWRHRGDVAHFYHAPIDTTFAMLRAGEPYTAYEPALRAARPYTARHVPWYITPETVTPEYLWYLDHLGSAHRGGVYWTTLAADARLGMESRALG